MAFRILEEILKATFLLEKHLVGTVQVYIIAGCVDTMDILGGSEQDRHIKYIKKELAKNK